MRLGDNREIGDVLHVVRHAPVDVCLVAPIGGVRTAGATATRRRVTPCRGTRARIVATIAAVDPLTTRVRDRDPGL